MSESRSPAPCACTGTDDTPEAYRVSESPLLVDSSADLLDLQDALDKRLSEACAILASLLVDSHSSRLNDSLLSDVLGGACSLLDEVSVLSNRQWDLYRLHYLTHREGAK